MIRRNYAALAAVSAAALLVATEEAAASAFAIREQSGSLQGQSFAGANAYAMDPSVIFFNPAGMSALDGTQAKVDLSALVLSIEFEDDGSSVPAPLPATLLGTNGSDAGADALVPAIYAMTSFGDFRVGVGVNAPFGLVTDYESNWIGRYAAITSAIRTLNVNPVVSYQVTRWLAVGGGAQIQRFDARLTNAFFTPVGDGLTELQADDIGYGFTAGALITPMPGTRIGVGFRSSVDHRLEGDVDINFPAGLGGGKTTLGASADLETPDVLGVSLYQQVTDRLSLAGTAEWTNWSDFQELRVNFDTPGIPDDVTPENWNDSWFFALGATYQATENLLLRGGVALDQTPVPNKFRTARLPDEDRYWISLGGTYQISDAVRVDAGYTHVFLPDASINEGFQPILGSPATGTLTGEYELGLDIVSIEINIEL